MQLNKKSISVVEIAAKDEKAARPTRHVRFTKDFTEAYDGMRLVRVSTPPLLDGLDANDSGTVTECLLSRDAVIEVKGEKNVLVDADGGDYVILYPALNREDAPYTVRAPLALDLKWPDTDSILPDEPPAYRVLVNPHLLLGLCKIACQFGDMMVMELRGERGAVYLETTDNQQTMRALIAPIQPEEPPPVSPQGGQAGKAYSIRKGRGPDRKSKAAGE